MASRDAGSRLHASWHMVSCHNHSLQPPLNSRHLHYQTFWSAGTWTSGRSSHWIHMVSWVGNTLLWLWMLQAPSLMSMSSAIMLSQRLLGQRMGTALTPNLGPYTNLILPRLQYCVKNPSPGAHSTQSFHDSMKKFGLVLPFGTFLR